MSSEDLILPQKRKGSKNKRCSFFRSHTKYPKITCCFWLQNQNIQPFCKSNIYSKWEMVKHKRIFSTTQWYILFNNICTLLIHSKLQKKKKKQNGPYLKKFQQRKMIIDRIIISITCDESRYFWWCSLDRFSMESLPHSFLLMVKHLFWSLCLLSENNLERNRGDGEREEKGKRENINLWYESG